MRILLSAAVAAFVFVFSQQVFSAGQSAKTSITTSKNRSAPMRIEQPHIHILPNSSYIIYVVGLAGSASAPGAFGLIMLGGILKALECPLPSDDTVVTKIIGDRKALGLEGIVCQKDPTNCLASIPQGTDVWQECDNQGEQAVCLVVGHWKYPQASWYLGGSYDGFTPIVQQMIGTDCN